MKSHILVVDDEVIIGRILSEELEDAGYKCFTAESGKEALEIIEKHDISIVISDVKMPYMSGIEFLEKLIQTHSNPPPVILVTAFSESTIQEAYSKGAQAVYPKPIDYEALMEAVREKLKPKSEQWLKQLPQVDQSYDKTFSSLEEASKSIFLGQGGFSSQIDHNLKVDQAISFELIFGENLFLKGQGVVKWTQKSTNQNDSDIMGVEFIYLCDQSKENLEKVRTSLQGEGYIPWVCLLKNAG